MPLYPILATLAGALMLVSGCAVQPTGTANTANADMDDVSGCIARLGRRAVLSSGTLQGPELNLVNWNIHKGKDTAWARDLAGLHPEPDLLTLQEASPMDDAWRVLTPSHHRSFAEGFGIRDATTGVMTLSAARPLTECQLVSLEPWFSTRKATLVTEYALADREQTLLVLNIHGINFTVGVSGLEKQLRKTHKIIAAHDGPVLFSGDFNTWRGKRIRMLDNMLQTSGLTRLFFSVDHRKRFRGWPLDHIYVRGFDTLEATTRALASSDHNPMVVRLVLTDPQSDLAASP